MPAIVEVQSIIVAIHAAMDPDMIDIYTVAPIEVRAPESAVGQKAVPDRQIPAAIEQNEKGPITVRTAAECGAVAIDGSLPFQGNILGIVCVDNRRAAVGRPLKAFSVMVNVGASQEMGLRCKLERHIALELNGTEQKVACGNHHHAAPVARTGINSGLECLGV